jgi:two-component system, response regulator PdtaR
MTPLNECVLVAEDEFLIADLWSFHLEEMGLRVCGIAASATEAIALAQEHRPQLVLMDMRLRGDSDGVDAALVIHATVGSGVVFITGATEPETTARIHLDHPKAILYKPVSEKQFQDTVRLALRSVATGSEPDRAKFSVQLPGETPLPSFKSGYR